MTQMPMFPPLPFPFTPSKQNEVYPSILCSYCLSLSKSAVAELQLLISVIRKPEKERLENKRSKFEIEVCGKHLFSTSSSRTHNFTRNFLLAFLNRNVILPNVYIYSAMLFVFFRRRMKFACSRFIAIVIVFLLFSFNTRLFRGVVKARFRVVEVIDIRKKDIFGWSHENTRHFVGFPVRNCVAVGLLVG
jgi:hypothetical protein